MEFSNLKNRVDHWQHFKSGDFGQKWNSSKVIVREGRGAIAPLLEILNDPTADAETHWFTIRALGNFPEPEVITAIAAQIGDNPCQTRHSPEQAVELSNFAIETLAAMGTLAIEVLSQLLHNPHQRLLATKALNQVRSSGIITPLVAVAQDEDAMVRYYAIDALGSFHRAEITPVLLAALKDPSATVRKTAVMALGRRQDLQISHQLSQQLQPFLWDIDLAVSCQAALALGRLGADDALDALQQVLLSEHTPLALRIDTVRALEWYCDRPHPEPHAQSQTPHRAFNLLTQALEHFKSAPVPRDHHQPHQGQASPDQAQIQIAIIRILGSQRSMASLATKILIKQIQHQPSASVAQAIIMALANLEQPQAFEALLPLLKHPNDAVTIHTIAALKRLEPDQSLTRVTDYLQHFPKHQTDVLNLW